MIKKISLSLIALFTFSTGSLFASELKPMIQFGYDFGGKTLATVEQYDYYNGYENSKIRAGQGFSFEAGAAIDNPQSNLELQFLVGYKFDRESNYDGSLTWDQIPFSALAMFKSHKWQFGGGVTYHLNPELSGSTVGDNNFNGSIDDEYDNAIGGIVQVQYNVSEATAIGLRGTFIEYELKNDPSVVAKGNSVGINLSYKFGGHSEFR